MIEERVRKGIAELKCRECVLALPRQQSMWELTFAKSLKWSNVKLTPRSRSWSQTDAFLLANACARMTSAVCMETESACELRMRLFFAYQLLNWYRVAQLGQVQLALALFL